MNDCREVQGFLQAYLDGEFEEAERVAIANHLESCESCRRIAQAQAALRRRLRASVPPAVAPPWLQQRVRRALAQADRAERRAIWLKRWLVPSAIAALLLLGTLMSRQQQIPIEADLAARSIEMHRRELPLDVNGPSPEAISRFFSDKVPFAVRPPTFAQPQAQLVGGRLSNLREYQAAYLIYRVNGRRVSVFIFDSTALHPHETGWELGLNSQAPARGRQVQWLNLRGYNVALFAAGGTGYAVASDLDATRLGQLISHSR